ncbi:MAG: DUF3866 family protein [Firmicutes bacterium]|nr:DUF3866 family protein [Bacillota bacterium]
MIRWRYGEVVRETGRRGNLARLEVIVDGRAEAAVNMEKLAGPAAPGDKVLLNTGALRLGLGSGGYHLVAHVLGRESDFGAGPGHLMKLRYTPFQLRVLAVGEDASPCGPAVRRFSGLGGMPVVAAELHSMVPGVLAGMKDVLGRRAKIAYLMSDGGALPLEISDLVPAMRAAGLLDACITFGHAFGGDLEALNVYDALAAAREAVGATAAVIAMGPGVAGTGTSYGFTGIEQGEHLNAVRALGGSPVAAMRLSFADSRTRHRGISHHSLTVLGRVTLVRALIALPELTGGKMAFIQGQIARYGLSARHEIVFEPRTVPLLQNLKDRFPGLKTMGRTPEEDPEYFQAAIAAGLAAGDIARRQREPGRR